MNNRILIISGIGVIAGGLAYYLANRSKQAKRLQPAINEGNSNTEGESMIHRVMKKSKEKTMNGRH